MNFFDIFDFLGLNQNLAKALGFYTEGMLQSQRSTGRNRNLLPN